MIITAYHDDKNVRQSLMAILGDDPECDAIDCRPHPLLNSFSDNFRITIADVARFIIELKQNDT